MLTLLTASLVFAQLSVPLDLPFGAPTLEQDRLLACMTEARSDPALAITTASQWLEGLAGPATSAPQQCLGFAYMGVLRWQAAEQAFVASRDALAETDLAARARIGTMAGNAALADQRPADALALFVAAQADATAAGDRELAGSISADRARAYVAMDQQLNAAQALAQGRELATQDPAVWLLSATLARRMEDLASARGWIAIAAALAPSDPAIGLEAGVIAVLGGSDEAARQSWQSVIDLAPQSPQATTARAYIAQLAEPATPQENGR
jgi:tetratricopeptide (TPR) repeat protein